MIIRSCIYFFLIFYVTDSTTGEHRKWKQTRTPRRKTLHELLMRSRNVASFPEEGRSFGESLPKVTDIKEEINQKVVVSLPKVKSASEIPKSPAVTELSMSRFAPKAAISLNMPKAAEIGDSVSGYNGPNMFGPAPSYADPSFLSAVMNQAEQANFRYPRRRPKPQTVLQQKIERKSDFDVATPFEDFPSEFHGLLKIPMHINRNESTNDDITTSKKVTPLISGGYANIETGHKKNTSKNIVRRKPIYRPARKKLSGNPTNPITPNLPALSKSKIPSNQRRLQRPTFPKRLPPVRTGNKPLNNKIKQPFRVRIERPPLVTKNPIAPYVPSKNTTLLNNDPTENVIKKHSNQNLQLNPINIQITNLKEENTPEKLTIDKKVIYKPKDISNFVNLEDSITNTENSKINNGIKLQPMRPKQTNAINGQRNFTPSKLDPYYNKPKVPTFMQSQIKSKESPNYYNPLVLPPVINSYVTPNTLRRMDDNTFHNFNHHVPPQSNNIKQLSKTFTQPKIQKQQQIIPLRPPKNYYKNPFIPPRPPQTNQRRNSFYNHPTFIPSRVPLRGPPRPKRRRQNKPSFFDRFFSKRRGETDTYSNSVNWKTASYKKPKNSHVDYILSNGPKPKHGTKIMVVGPFKTPPLGAPNFKSSGKNRKNAIIKHGGISYKSSLVKGWDKHIPYPGHSLEHSPVTPSKYKQQYPKNIRLQNQKNQSRNSIPVPISSHRNDNRNPKLIPKYLQEVSEADKERIIAAKLYFPKSTSIRRSGAERNIIPLPVPALETNGKQIFKVKNFILPSLPSKPKARAPTVKKHQSSKISKQTVKQQPITKNYLPNLEIPSSITEFGKAPLTYEGWKVLKEKKYAKNKLINRNKTPRPNILEEAAPLARHVFYQPKVTFYQNNAKEEIIMGRQDNNKKMVRYSSTLNVEAPEVVKSVLIRNPYTL